MPTSEKVRLTDLLRAWRDGDQSAAETLFDALYSELRACAARYLGRERRDHTLQPTALVHEAYLRLAKQNDVNWQGREQFVAVAASMMRRVLVDHARAHGADKRGGDWERISIDLGHIEDLHNPADLLVLDAAVEELASVDPFQGRLVELRFFGGLSIEETASVLKSSPATVKREWAVARAWLFRRLEGEAR